MYSKILKVLIALILIAGSLPLGQASSQQSLFINPEYMGVIQQKINYYSVYPNEAKLKGWEGVVKVKFTLAEDGRVKDIDVAESSGYPLLDAAAILAIKDASPYPFPQDYPGEEVELVLPINYSRPVPSPEELKPAQERIIPLAQEGLPAAKDKETTIQEAAPEPKFSIETPEPMLEKAQEPQLDPSFMPQPKELKYFIDLAVQNNQPTKVAQEEIALAKLKVTEAQRGILPTVKLINYYTEGEVYKIKYAEKELKAQIEQPIYYSGRLQDTIRQSKANLEITKKNYDRLELDVIQKAETAYYNLVAAKMHLREKITLAEEANSMLSKIGRLAKAGMIIPLELASSKSWFKQLELQVKGIEQELFMAELTFKQIMNVRETPQIKAQLLGAKKLDLNFENCLQIAMQSRPEVYLSEMLVKFNRYGKRIELEKGAFKTDLVGSYGHYSGHYVTEPWKTSSNWYAGFKVTKPFGASTTNASLTTETVQPKFGQTSSTQSSTMSGEFNLLDNMKSIAEKKKAGIDLLRSMGDLDETLKTIHFEVQDAFLKYEKAILQLNTAEGEMNFRRTEAEITKTRAMVGEGSYSGVIESLYSFSEAHTRYIQALANYYISLANLKKACGYGLQI
ncbi:MAG: TonB family protein [Candidatus Omnitrophota bacterium]